MFTSLKISLVISTHNYRYRTRKIDIILTSLVFLVDTNEFSVFVSAEQFGLSLFYFNSELTSTVNKCVRGD